MPSNLSARIERLEVDDGAITIVRTCANCGRLVPGNPALSSTRSVVGSSYNDEATGPELQNTAETASEPSETSSSPEPKSEDQEEDVEPGLKEPGIRLDSRSERRDTPCDRPPPAPVGRSVTIMRSYGNPPRLH